MSARAERYLGRLDRKAKARITRKLDQVCADPYNPRLSKPLATEDQARAARVGDWRVLFYIDEDNKIVEATAIGPRGQIYREL